MNQDIFIVQNDGIAITEKSDNQMRFWYELKAAPFQALGEVTKYFTLGFNASLFAGYRILYFRNSDLALGINTSFFEFQAEGLITSSENYLLSLGPDIRWSFDLNNSLSMFLHLSSGVSLFIVDVENESYVNTYIPFITAGLGTTYAFTRNFGVTLILNYSVFFEGSTVISGFIPGGGISLFY
jgi:hypothetical protein